MALDTRQTFYRMLLDKYADIINEKERRTVGEIKGLINPDDLSIQNIVARFRPETYLFEKDFLFTAQQIFEFLTHEIKYVPNELSINFWLSPTEILTHKVSDDEDLAVLVTTCLAALGDTKASVYIMELE
ncbi:MAG: hypothetical protein AABX02_04635, partial [archaeon]